MTSEQLQSVRAERWRQKSNPVLTAEDAQAWIEDIGLCLFLPRRHFLAAAPSFVEAVLGGPSEAPGRDAMENASALMRRLAADAAVVPLNLFGNSGLGGPASDQPDFLCSRETLPYIFSLIGGRNWKSGPGAKASPLMTEIWTLLNDGQARTAGEIQSALGRELTEAAVLRALAELWNGLRAIPAYDGDTTSWELTQARFAAEMGASQKVAQTTALSALVSLYLDGAVAASAEDIETFLSPLTARSRVREVVNGLSATRQLGLVSVGAQPLLHVAGALPEFAEEEPAKAEVEPRRPREERGERKPFERRPFRERAGAGEGGRPERGERPFPQREFRKRREGPAAGEGRFAKRERPERPERRERRAEGGGNFPKRKFGGDRERPRREHGDRGSAHPGSRGEARPERRSGEGERRPYGKRPFERSQRPSSPRSFDRNRPSSGGGGKFQPKKFGNAGPKPWQDRGERPAREDPRPFRPRREEEPGGERRPSKFREAGKAGEKRFGGPGRERGSKFGAAKKFGSRGGAGEREASRWSGSRPSGPRPSGPRPGRSERPASSGGFKREKPGEKRPFFRERPAKSEGERPRREPRTGEGAKQANRGGEWKAKTGGGGLSKSGGRGFGKSGKPGFKSGGKPPYKSGGKPGIKSEGGSGFKKTGFGKSARPFGKSGKPFGKSAKPFGKAAGPGRAGKPAPGRAKPGGFKPPFRKRKKQEGEE